MCLNAENDAIQYLQKKSLNLKKSFDEMTHELLTAISFDDKKFQANTKVNRIRNDSSSDPNSIELMKMKRSSIDIMSRFIALINQYECVDEMIQQINLNRNLNNDQLLELFAQMQNIKKSIATCDEDYQRLILIFSKLLANKFQLIPQTNVPKIQSQEHDGNDNHIEIECNANANDAELNNMEFFAMRDKDEDEDDDGHSDDENNEKLKRLRIDDGLDEFDLKITKSMFAPVLRQLKVKIDPIKTEMKERELKFLLAAGMDHEKILEFDKNVEREQLDADVDRLSEKSKLKPNRYDEMRSFLEQKQQISFMQANPFGLPLNSGDEDIIE